MFDPTVPIIAVPKTDIRYDKNTGNPFIYTRDGRPLELKRYGAAASNAELAMLTLRRFLKPVWMKAACIYQYKDITITHTLSDDRYVAEIYLGIEETLTFDLIY